LLFKNVVGRKWKKEKGWVDIYGMEEGLEKIAGRQELEESW